MSDILNRAKSDRRPQAARRPVRGRRTQEERSAETRAKLVNAAIAVVHESGYANLTISKVAQRAGLTNGAMQHHFTSRDDLIVAVLDALYPIVALPFEEIAAEHLSVEDRVGRVVDMFWRIYSRPEYLVIWDIAFGTRGDRALSARLKRYQREISKRVLETFSGLFQDVALSPEDAERIVDLIMGCLRGFALQRVFGVEHDSTDLRAIKEIACRQISELATRG